MHEQEQIAVQVLPEPEQLVGTAEASVTAEQDQTIYSVPHANGEVRSGTLRTIGEMCPAMARLSPAMRLLALEIQSIGHNVMAGKEQKQVKAADEAAGQTPSTSLDAILDRQHPKEKPIIAEERELVAPVQVVAPTKISVAEQLPSADPLVPFEQTLIETITAPVATAQQTKQTPRAEEQPAVAATAPAEQIDPIVVASPLATVHVPEQTIIKQVHAPVPIQMSSLPHIEQAPVQFVVPEMPSIRKTAIAKNPVVEQIQDTINSPSAGISPPAELLQNTNPSEAATVVLDEILDPQTTQTYVNLAREFDTFEPSDYLLEGPTAVLTESETITLEAAVTDAMPEGSLPDHILPAPMPIQREAVTHETVTATPTRPVESFRRAIEVVEASPVPTAPIVKEIAVGLHELPKTHEPAVESILTEIVSLTAEIQQLSAELPTAAIEMVSDKIDGLCTELLAILAIAPTPKTVAALRSLLLSPDISATLTEPHAAMPPDTAGTHERKHGWLGQHFLDFATDAYVLPQRMGSSALAGCAPA